MSLFPRNRVLVGALAVALTLLVPTGSAFAAKPGNSLNAKNCYKGGWTTMTQVDGTPFASQDACSAYGAHGGYYPRVFAVAFTNLDGVAGFNSASDVLIADLVDSNGSNTVNGGDTVHMGSYPLTLAGTTFGTFGVPSHTVLSGAVVNGGRAVVVTDVSFSAYEWRSATESQHYLEIGGGTTQIIDGIGSCPLDDSVYVEPNSPSAPSTSASDEACDFADNSFLDVTLNLP